MTLEHKSKNKKAFLLLIVLLLVAGLIFIFLFNKNDNLDSGIKVNSVGDDTGKMVFCTQEAKLCPDGSYVGRSGSNCEFSPCPLNDEVKSETPIQEPCPEDAKICSDGSVVFRVGLNCSFADCPEENYVWKRYKENGARLLFYYPESLLFNYISESDWPPLVKIIYEDFNCLETDLSSSLPNTVSKRLIGSRKYCISTESEGAAGSVFTNYTYTTPFEDGLVQISFGLRFPQCYNYDEMESLECQKERENFNLDSIVNDIVDRVETVIY